MSHRGIENLAEDLGAENAWHAFIEERVPVYARLLEHLRLELEGVFGATLARVWASRETSAIYERPLILLGALRYDALCEGTAHPLHAAIAQEPPSLAAASAEAVHASIGAERSRFWQAVDERTVQTNESSRAVAWLWPACSMHSLGVWDHMALLDLGTSAGLNLVADTLPMPWTRSDGAALSLAPRPRITQRLGLDRSPLDLRTDDAAQWLRACVWPGERARQTRLELGISQFRNMLQQPAAPTVEACDVQHALVRLRLLPAQTPVLAVQTIVRDYLPAAVKDAYTEGMHTWLTERAPVSALWVELELEGGGTSMDTAAAITVHFKDGSHQLKQLVLARCHPHPNVLQVDESAVKAFSEMVRAAGNR